MCKDLYTAHRGQFQSTLLLYTVSVLKWW